MDLLTEQELAFVESFAMTGNAKQSAILAGYSEDTAEQQGFHLRKKLIHEINEYYYANQENDKNYSYRYSNIGE